MTGIEVSETLRRLRTSLFLPYGLVVSAILGIFYLSIHFANSLDAYSRETSSDLFKNVYQKELEDIGKLTKDYSFWNDAVEKVFLSPNQDFIKDNFLGPYLADAFDVTRVLVLNADASVNMLVHNGEKLSGQLENVIHPDLRELVNLSLATDMNDPSPATGTLWIEDTLYLTSVSAFTPSETNELMDVNKAYGFLVMAKPIDVNLISSLETAYHFSELEINFEKSPHKERVLFYVIKSPSGNRLAEMAWRADLPGERFFDKAAPWISVLIALIFFMSIIFIRRVVRYTKETGETLDELNDSRGQLNTLAYYDPVTNLPNRSLFIDRLDQAVISNDRLGTLSVVLYIDLDGFKHVNDSMGHDVGDQILLMAGKRITQCTRNEDTVSRFGGDEFCILLKDFHVGEDSDAIVMQLLHELNQPFLIDKTECIVSASIGIVISPVDGKDPVELIKKADTAMYHAKSCGRNCYRYFTQELSDAVEYRSALLTQLKSSQINDEFSLVYQPIMSIVNKKIVGAEALLRWTNKELGSVPPDRFISQAERSGLIVPIGEWVLRKVLADSCAFREKYGQDFFMSINLSGRQLADKEFISSIKNLWGKKDDLSLTKFHVEITESYLMTKDSAAKDILGELVAMGFEVSLDDFGTGYSSLSYINNYPINIVKIDQSFIANYEKDYKGRNLISAIINMSKSLGLNVIVEGVETELQLNFLKNEGCDLIQGFYFSKPMSKEVFLSKNIII